MAQAQVMPVEITAQNRTRSAFTDLIRDLRSVRDTATAVAGTLSRGFTFAGAGAGGLAAVMGLSAAVKYLNDINKDLAEISKLSKSIETPTGKFQEMQIAAKMAGVSQEDFNKGVEKMARLINDAQREENTLSDLFEANNLKVTDRNGKLLTVNQTLSIAADLIQRAGTEQDKIKIAEMVGLTKDWVGHLEKGPEALERIQKAVRESGKIISSDLVDKAAQTQRSWDQFWSDWEQRAKSNIMKVIGYLNQIQAPDVNVAGMSTMEGFVQQDPRLKLTVGKGGPGGGAAHTDESGMISYINSLSKRTKIPVKDDAGGSEKDAFEKEVDRINKHVAMMKADALAIGQTQAAAAGLRAEFGLLQAAQRDGMVTDEQIEQYSKFRQTMSATDALLAAGIKLKDEHGEAFKRMVDKMISSASALDQLKNQFDAINEAVRFAGGTFVDILDKIGDKTTKFSDLARDALGKFKRAAIDALITGGGPLAGLFGMKSQTGGAGGILGMLFGGFKMSMGIPGFAKGFDGVVGGSGGSDSQLVSFWGTPGERVTVSPTTGGGGQGGAIPRMDITVRVDGALGDADLMQRVQAGAAVAAQSAVANFSKHGFGPRMDQYRARGV